MPDLHQTAEAADLAVGCFTTGPGYHCWREHGTERWLLFCTSSGMGRVGHPLGDIPCPPGSLVLLHPHVLHDYGLASGSRRWAFRWAHVAARPAWLPLLAWPETVPGIARLDPEPQVFATIDGLLAEAQNHLRDPRPHAEAFAVHALESVWLHAARASTMSPSPDARVLDTLAWIDSHLEEDISLAHAARRVGLSASRLNVLVRIQLGQPLHAYVLRRRLERARQLLTMTTLPVAQVATACGFRDPFYFSNRFRRTTGLSPRAWRQT